MLNGMLNIYKEAGYTSSDVVARLRGILHMRKIGHTGTLDPMAEGVLPVCLGNGTKLASLIEDRDKEYRAVMRLGVSTDTQDMTGAVLEEAGEEVLSSITPEKIKEACAGFVGGYDQIPPMYSAIKVNGKKLYELARAGKSVERKPRRIHIYELELERVDMPLVTMRVVCSKGTYIRTLCEDIGRQLGCPAAVKLERVRAAQFLENPGALLEGEPFTLPAALPLRAEQPQHGAVGVCSRGAAGIVAFRAERDDVPVFEDDKESPEHKIRDVACGACLRADDRRAQLRVAAVAFLLPAERQRGISLHGSGALYAPYFMDSRRPQTPCLRPHKGRGVHGDRAAAAAGKAAYVLRGKAFVPVCGRRRVGVYPDAAVGKLYAHDMVSRGLPRYAVAECLDAGRLLLPRDCGGEQGFRAGLREACARAC